MGHSLLIVHIMLYSLKTTCFTDDKIIKEVCVSLISQKEGASLKKDSLEKEALIRTIVVKFKGLRLRD